jgi:hypothetical protein
MADLTGQLTMTFLGSSVGGGSGGRCRSGIISPRSSLTSLTSPTSTPSIVVPRHTQRSSIRARRDTLGAQGVAATLGRASM